MKTQLVNTARFLVLIWQCQLGRLQLTSLVSCAAVRAFHRI